MYNRPYLQNMYTKLHINRTKIDGVIVSRRGDEFGHRVSAPSLGAGKFPTDCYGQINRSERTPSGFIQKVNGGKYGVTLFACEKIAKNIKFLFQ